MSLELQQSAQAVAALASKLDEMRRDETRTPSCTAMVGGMATLDRDSAVRGIRFHIDRVESELSRAIEKWREVSRREDRVAKNAMDEVLK